MIISTTDSDMIYKFDNLVAQNPESWNIEEFLMDRGEVVSKTYSAPKEWLSFSKPAEEPVKIDQKENNFKQELNRFSSEKDLDLDL